MADVFAARILKKEKKKKEQTVREYCNVKSKSEVNFLEPMQ